MKALTPIQETVLAYLRTYHAENDCLPSTRQIAKHFRWSSQTAAMGHLQALVKKGHLETITETTRRTFYRFARSEPTGQIQDENGRPLTIGMRVGCRQAGQPRDWSQRGLTLTGYEPGTDQPYITNEGRFALAVKDHQPDMDEWIERNVTA